MKSTSSNLSGSKAYIVDDMISTGGTIVKAAKVLSSLGVKEMTAVCVHAIMVADATNRIKAAGVSNIIASNTIPTEFSEVDVSKVVTDYIRLLG
jgi:ribose-phosphate pyrophosphokinase